MTEKTVINLATGLEDPERVTIAFLVGGAAVEKGKPVTMFLTKDAVRLALPGEAEGVACDGCPPLERLFQQYADGGGELLVCPICFTARKLDGSELVPNASIGGATPLWDWIGEGRDGLQLLRGVEMAIDVDIDVELLKSEIKKMYARVSQEPTEDFIFPTGRAWAEDLGYPPELANVPEGAVESFAGVANPFSLGRLSAGERVLDLGSGAGTDSLVAAQMVGDGGRVTGIDMTPEMLAKARSAAAEMGAANVEFVESEAEPLPLADGCFDVVISNGVIDLIPDKDAVFAELFRVLAPGGRMQIADVTIQNPVSEEGRRNIDLWTG